MLFHSANKQLPCTKQTDCIILVITALVLLHSLTMKLYTHVLLKMSKLSLRAFTEAADMLSRRFVPRLR